MNPQAMNDSYPRICSEVGLTCDNCVAATARNLATICKGLRGAALGQLFVQIYPASACAPMHAHFAAEYREAASEVASLGESLPPRRGVRFARPRTMAAVA